ncbi:MAG: DUF3379 domain-containing protein [Betaproteobacteria bacterium]|nr:DUF3379 domain-containing protein [Betaproteobacteria bacterium]
MNCLDYRRQLLCGTGETDGMRVHRLQCAGCASEWQEQAAFEGALRAGLEVPVPAGFGERMANAQVARRRRFLAVAATALVAAGAGGYAWLARQDPLALANIDFVMKEEANSIMMGAIPHAEAQAALAATLPLDRLEGLGQVKHVRPCPFNGATAYHVVLMVPQGKVSLLVMPSTRIRGRHHAEKEGMHAEVMPAGNGSVGVIGIDAAVVDSVAGALKA